MSPHTPEPHSWRQRLLFPVLVVFIGMLILGAWRGEVRPRFLDAPAEGARNWLRRIGVHSGLAVFSSHYQARRNRTSKGRCLQVLARSGDGPFERIYPERTCPPQGLRLAVLPEEVMVTRFLMWATAEEARRRMEDAPPPPPGWVLLPDVLLPSLAYHFDHRERLKGTPRDELLMLVTNHVLLLDTGEDAVQYVLILDVDFEAGPSRFLWFPSEREVSELWTRRLPE